MQSTNNHDRRTIQAANKYEWLDAVQDAALGNATMNVAYAIARFANPEPDHAGDWSCWPSTKAIAERAGCSRRSVVSAVAKLEECGLLDVVRGGVRDGRNVSTRYLFAIGVVQPLHYGGATIAEGGCNDCTQPLPPTTTNDLLHEPSGQQPPSSAVADSDLSVATTHSAVPPQGHGEDEHEEQDEPSSGTPASAVRPVAAGAGQEQAKEGAVDPRRLNGRALLAYRWGEEATTRAVQLSMQCAGGLMPEELFDLLAELDGEFADWCSDYGSRIASRAAWSEREAAGILASKLRTFDRGIWLAA